MDYKFSDHNCPPLAMIPAFCEDATRWLEMDPLHVIAVHCKAGKSRTGTMICALLLHRQDFVDPEECMLHYGAMRTLDGKGVTIPSQRRYIHHYRTILDANGHLPDPRPMQLTSIRFIDLPPGMNVGFAG